MGDLNKKRSAVSPAQSAPVGKHLRFDLDHEDQEETKERASSSSSENNNESSIEARMMKILQESLQNGLSTIMEQLKGERKAQDEKMAEFESRLRGVSSTLYQHQHHHQRQRWNRRMLYKYQSWTSIKVFKMLDPLKILWLCMKMQPSMED